MPYLDVPIREYDSWKDALQSVRWWNHTIRFSVVYDSFSEDYLLFAADMQSVWDYEETINDISDVDWFINRAYVAFTNFERSKKISYGPSVKVLDQGLINAVVV